MGLLLARWAPSPCRRLSRPRTTTGPPSRPEAISRQRACPSPPWLGGGKGGLGRFPRSPRTDRRGWRPAIPLQPRHGYAAGIPRGLPTGARNRLRSRRPQVLRSSVHCCPAHIHQIRAGRYLEGVQALVHFVTPIRPRLPGPGPSGGSGPSRRCQGCFPPSPALPGSGCPRLHRPAATGRRWALSSHWVTWRLVAHSCLQSTRGAFVAKLSNYLQLQFLVAVDNETTLLNSSVTRSGACLGGDNGGKTDVSARAEHDNPGASMTLLQRPRVSTARRAPRRPPCEFRPCRRKALVEKLEDCSSRHAGFCPRLRKKERP